MCVDVGFDIIYKITSKSKRSGEKIKTKRMIYVIFFNGIIDPGYVII